jgi:hypothetical protein
MTRFDTICTLGCLIGHETFVKVWMIIQKVQLFQPLIGFNQSPYETVSLFIRLFLKPQRRTDRCGCYNEQRPTVENGTDFCRSNSTVTKDLADKECGKPYSVRVTTSSASDLLDPFD